MSKLVDLKLPKKTKAQLKKEMEPTIGIEDREKYPWGAKLNFDKEQIEKIKGLQSVAGGEKVEIRAIGKVVEVRITDAEEGRKRHNVEIQVQKIAITPKAKEKAASLDETITTISQARRM